MALRVALRADRQRAQRGDLCAAFSVRGERQIGLEYVEALLAAVDLEVRRRDETAQDLR